MGVHIGIGRSKDGKYIAWKLQIVKLEPSSDPENAMWLCNCEGNSANGRYLLGGLLTV